MHVDLRNLQELTGGNIETQHILFSAFLRSSSECIDDLAHHTGPDHAEIWRRKAHAFKGICYNLGAAMLGDLCKVAQEKFTASASEKQRLLADIAKEHAEVKHILEAALATDMAPSST